MSTQAYFFSFTNDLDQRHLTSFLEGGSGAKYSMDNNQCKLNLSSRENISTFFAFHIENPMYVSIRILVFQILQRSTFSSYDRILKTIIIFSHNFFQTSPHFFFLMDSRAPSFFLRSSTKKDDRIPELTFFLRSPAKKDDRIPELTFSFFLSLVPRQK